MSLFEPVVNVTDRGVFCGPRAITLLTGVPVTRIERMIQRQRGRYGRDRRGRKRPIKGTGTGEVLAVLRKLGCKVEALPAGKLEPTLGRFADDTATVKASFLISVPGHWVVVSGGKIADSTSPRRLVQAAWKVIAPETPRYTVDDEPTPRARIKKPKPNLRAVRAARVAAAIKRWETKKKRAETALKKLRAKARYYERERKGDS